MQFKAKIPAVKSCYLKSKTTFYGDVCYVEFMFFVVGGGGLGVFLVPPDKQSSQCILKLWTIALSNIA